MKTGQLSVICHLHFVREKGLMVFINIRVNCLKQAVKELANVTARPFVVVFERSRQLRKSPEERRARRKIKETMCWSAYLETEEGREVNNLGCSSQMYEGQVAIWSSQKSFTKGKSHLTNLIGFFNKIAWWIMGDQQMSFILTLSGLSSLSHITSLLAN